ncbi:MAG: hypothetical protein ACKN86_03580, partial [Crocinitomicaceae bacterium]
MHKGQNTMKNQPTKNQKKIKVVLTPQKIFLWLIIGLLFLGLASCATKNSVTRQKPSNYFKYFHEGVRFQLTGDYQKAIEAFEKSLKEETNDDAAAYGIALSLEK